MLVLEVDLVAVVGLSFVEIVSPKKRQICFHIALQTQLYSLN
jgi:hypothetical protein